MRLWIRLCLVATLTACAVAPTAPPSTVSELGPVPAFDRGSMPDRDGGALRSAALDYYAQGDYVRALRYGYWAAKTIPTDVRLRLLLGIVYDGGFDRPDLALPEYERALSLKPDRRFHERLTRRVHFLNRRLLQDSTQTLLTSNPGNPLSENWLAVYPLAIEGPRIPDSGLEFGLLDCVLPEIKLRSAALHVDPFTSWIVSQVYREVSNDPTPAGFARWCGAGTVLTGRMSDLGLGRIRVTLELLSPLGNVVYASSPFIIDQQRPSEAYQAILGASSEALSLIGTDSATGPPVTNPAAFSLYAQGLAEYLVGQIHDAEGHIRDATELNEPSTLLNQRLHWAESDLLGGQEGAELLEDYHRLLNLPDPNRMVRDRLTRGHTLGSPALSGLSGTETENPYKPPRPEPTTP